MTSNQARGQRHEYLIRDHLKTYGYWVIKAGGSKGEADLVALRADSQPLLVQVKSPGPQIPPVERQALWEAAVASGSLPITAHKPSRKPIMYRRLTGVGPKDWVPWQPEVLLKLESA